MCPVGGLTLPSGTYAMTGATSALPSSRATLSASAFTRTLCLPSAMCGPFCSVPPMGTRMVVLPARMAAASSGEVKSSSITELGCAVAAAETSSRARMNPGNEQRRIGAFYARDIAFLCRGSTRARPATWHAFAAIMRPLRDKRPRSTAGRPALHGRESGQVRKEAATANACKCRDHGSPPLMVRPAVMSSATPNVRTGIARWHAPALGLAVSEVPR